MRKNFADLLSYDVEVLGFDPDSLRERYARERDRRIHDRGMGQYVRMDRQLSENGAADPYMPVTPREPLNRDVDVLVLGAGFGGLLSGAYLRKAGINDFLILDAAGDFGGTWYWNRYPNAQCDTEAYVYLPLLEETGYMPTRNYAYAPEIFEHARRIGHTFDLYSSALFHTMIDGARWDEETGRWIVATDRGDSLRARNLVLANGGLVRPKLPNVPGLSDFKGRMFHTSRWDYDYTGGDSQGSLHNLKDKRVGIIGTGATAIQCTVPLAEWSKELYIFQRTPSSIGVRGNKVTDPKWVETLGPGWQRRRAEDFIAAIEGREYEGDYPGDGWIDLVAYNAKAVRALRAQGLLTDPEDVGRVTENADFEKMEQIRQRVSEIVKDPQTAELLKPWYRPLCKRPCFHDEYLSIFNEPNVHLVDAADGGIERLTETDVVVGGQHYELDCLIFATGFETTPAFAPKSGFEIIGRGGMPLSEKWRDGFSTMFGYTTAGFPNCYFVARTQAPMPQNLTTLLEEAAEHIAYVISEAKARGADTVDTTEEGEKRWQEEMISKRRDPLRFHASCTPGYFNNEGELSETGHSLFAGLYGGGTIGFFELVRAWRTEGKLDGLILEKHVTKADTLSPAHID